MENSGADHPDFAMRLHRAISARGVNLSWLRRRLVDSGNPVSLSTLSYWRSGLRAPQGATSMAAVDHIETLLDLPEGHLTASVPRSHRVAVPPPEIPIAEKGLRNAAQETLEALHGSPQWGLRDVSSTVVVDVDVDGRIRRRAVRSLVQATDGTVLDLPYIHIAPERFDDPPTPTDVHGARITREHVHPSRLVAGWVFTLDTPLHAPARTMIEWTADFPGDGVPLTRCEHRVARRCNELTIWVRFDPAQLPEWCEERAEDAHGVVTTRPIEPARSIHTSRRDFGPGTLELRWEFDPGD